MNSFDDVLEEAIAKAYARDVGTVLDYLRERPAFANLPKEFDFGLVTRYDARGVVFKMRITGGGFTARHVGEVPMRILMGDDKKAFDAAVGRLIDELCIGFASHFGVKT